LICLERLATDIEQTPVLADLRGMEKVDDCDILGTA
jgi:hypothetical protein